MKVGLVSSKGGHLGQIKIIFTKEVIGKNEAVLITESEKKIKKEEKSFLGKFRTYYFKKDNLSFNPIEYLIATINLIRLYRKENISLIVTNGAQISIPAVIGAKLIGIKSIFIDTIIRVKTPNWSARFCYYFSDVFIVQHKSMMGKYGKKAIYRGGVL